MRIGTIFPNLGKDFRVLVVGAHGDDEIIGCGGTIAWLVDHGAAVTVITATRRETAYATIEGKEGAAAAADREMAAANEVLGVQQREVLGLPNQGVTNDRETFQAFVRLIRKYQPHVILTHGPSDHHRDHRAIAALVEEARWKAWENLAPDWGAPWETDFVLAFEIFDLIPHPHCVVTFPEAYLDRKLQAMRMQVSQGQILRGIEQHIRGLAMVRGGFVGGTGCYGEAFTVDAFHPTHIPLT